MNVRRCGWPRLLQILARQLHRHFDGRRSVVGIEDARQPGRQHRQQTLGELDRRLVRAVGEDDVLELARLRGERLVQPRMAMAVNVHPPRRDAVEEPPAVLGVEIDALAPDDRQRRRPRQHLRVGMPDRCGRRGRRGSSVMDRNSGSSRPSGSSAGSLRDERLRLSDIAASAARRARRPRRTARSPRDSRCSADRPSRRRPLAPDARAAPRASAACD